VIDFAVLNGLVLIFIPGKSTSLYILFKSISFLAAVINSYYLNKYWVFREQISTKSKFGHFFVVSVVGFFLNVATASLVFHVLSGTYPNQTQLIANAGAIVGTGVVLFWNFVGYKFFVFKS